jgi:hypothetical protein
MRTTTLQQVQEWRRREKDRERIAGLSCCDVARRTMILLTSSEVAGADWWLWLALAPACIVLRLDSAPSPECPLRHPHTTPYLTHTKCPPRPPSLRAAPAWTVSTSLSACFACPSSTRKRALFSRVARLAQVHHCYHESMSVHPGTRPRHLVRAHTTLRSLQRVRSRPVYSLRPPTGPHRSAACPPSLVHQRSTQSIRLPLNKSFPRLLDTLWSI